MDSNLQNAAWLLSWLPASDAECLVKRLPAPAAEAVRRVTIGNKPRSELRKQTAREFLRQLRREERGVRREA